MINDFYPTMSIDEMKALPINNIADKDCALFMWFTYSHLPQAIELCKAWGFKYKTVAFVWLKLSNKGNILSNIGAWTMGNTEAVLIATRGNMLKHKKRNDIKQIVMPNTELRLKGADRHSRKPKEVRERIELLFGDIPRIELFARQNFSGWDAWGNEVSESVEINNVQPKNDMQCGVGKNNI
jgi:N6-adenosine-specific RNA methylase IME4